MSELTLAAKKVRVLIVDDAPSMRSLLLAILKSFGIKNVYEAGDGTAALTVLEARDIDLIVCDWEMPKMDGLALFNNIRNNDSYAKIPFILVTSMSEVDKVKIALKAGVEHYIVKPFKPDTIFSKINTIFPATQE